VLKAALPETVRRAISDLKRTEPAARTTLVRLWLGRALSSQATGLPRGMQPSPRVLFVCHGNILRSAVAATLYQRLAGRYSAGGGTADSAGLHAVANRPADPRGIIVAREMGVSLTEHLAKPVSRDLIDGADLLLVMDRVNEAELVRRFPHAASKVRLLGSFAPPPDVRVIPDPFLGSEAAVRAAFGHIERSVAELVRRVVASA